MADQNKKDLQEVNKLLGEIQKAYDKLGDKNPFRGMDTSKISDFDTEINKLETALDGVESKVRRIDTSFGDLKDTLKAVVNEFNPKAINSAKLLEKGMKGLVSEARKMADEEENIGDLSKKNLEKILERAESSQKLAKDNAAEVLKGIKLEDTKGKRLKISELDSLKSIDKRKKEFRDLTSEQRAALGILVDENEIQGDLIEGIKGRIKLEDDFNKKIGIGGQLAGGLDKALQKVGLPALGISDSINETRKNFIKANLAGGDTKKNFSILKNLGGNLKTNLAAAFSKANLIQFALYELVKAFQFVDKSSGEIAKNFGVSTTEAKKLVSESNSISAATGNVLISTEDIIKAQGTLNQIMGTSVIFSKELSAEFANIQERTGLSNEAMAGFATTAVSTGKTITDQLEGVQKITMELNAQEGLSLNVKEIQEGIGKASNSFRLNMDNSTEALAQAVFKAKSLGMELSDMEKISSSMLDFENSIASELEAELLTGRQLNLERARAAALQGDLATVAEEVAQNIGSAEEFTKMNVLQQEALAKSVGVSRDELAKMLIQEQKNEAVRKFGFDNISDAQAQYNKALKEGNLSEELKNKLAKAGLLNQMKSATIQEKLSASFAKLQDIFIAIAEPLLPIIDVLVDVLSILGPISAALTPIVKLAANLSMFIVGPILSALKAIVNYINNNLMTVINGIKDTFEDAFSFFKDGKILKGFVRLGTGILNVFTGIIGNMAILVEDLINGITSGWIGPLLKFFGGDGDELKIDVASGFKEGMRVEMAEGGIVSGPTNALIGEAGPEAVIPLGPNKEMNVAGVNKMINLLEKMVEKDTNVYMDGNKVGTQLALSNPRMQ